MEASVRPVIRHDPAPLPVDHASARHRDVMAVRRSQEIAAFLLRSVRRFRLHDMLPV